MKDDEKKVFEGFTNKASEYLNDKDKAERLLRDAAQKAGQNKGPLGELWEKILLLTDLIKDYIPGAYRTIPTGTILMVIAAIVYFVSPIDAIPDIIGPLGYIDDAAVIAWVICQISSDLEAYKVWKY